MVTPGSGWTIVFTPDGDTAPAPRNYSAIDRALGEEGAALRRQKAIEDAGLGYGWGSELVGPIADELGAAVGATSDYVRGVVRGRDPSWRDLYDEHLDIERGEQRRYRENNPITSIAANVAGGLTVAPLRAGQAVAASLGVGKAAAAPRVGQAIRQGAAVGAAGGGAAGFAEGEGGFEPRLNSAAVGSAAGAGVGAAIPILGRAFQHISRGLARVKGLKGPGAERRAMTMLQNALEKDGITPAQLQAMAATGKPVTLADLGPSTRRLVGAAGRQSEDAGRILEEFMEPRTAGQYGRINDDLARLLGVQGDDFTRTSGEIAARRAADAGPGYNRAYSQQAPQLSVTGRKILETPTGKRAVAMAARNMDDMRMPFKDQSGNYTVQGLDQIQRAMRDIVEGTKGRRMAETSSVRSSLRDRFLAELPEDLRAVMSRYRNESDLIAALQSGRDFFRGDRETVAAAIRDLTDQELELFRLGAAREILEKMGGKIDSGDASGMFQNENIRRRLRAVFPDDQTFDEFIELARLERTMQNTRNEVLKGSQTAGRTAADDQFQTSALGEAAMDVATGGGGVNVIQAILNLGRQGAVRYLQGVNEEVGRAIARQSTVPITRAMSLPAPAGGASVPVTAPATRSLIEATSPATSSAAGVISTRDTEPRRAGPSFSIISPR